MSQTIEKLIIDTAQALIEQNDLEVNQPIDRETALFGEQGILDSIGLVSLVVELEEAIADRFNTTISLADEKAMSQKTSPFRSVQSLALYANTLVQEAS